MPSPEPDRQWEVRKQKLVSVLTNFSQTSPVMQLLHLEDRRESLHAVVGFHTKTLARSPGGEPGLRGPVVAGIRYHQRYLSEIPVPWSLVSILEPLEIYHPSVNENGGMCLGHPLAGISMEEILHTTWAAIVLNTRVVTTVDWKVFNPSAAAYIRAHQDRFPITDRGLLEQ